MQTAAAAAALVPPIAINVKGEIKGQRAAAAKAPQRGGESGCDRFTFGGDPSLKSGQRYAFFLVQLVDNHGNPLDEQLVLDAWPVGGDGSVDSPKDGELTSTEFKDAIDRGRTPTPPPNPGEPSPTTPG